MKRYVLLENNTITKVNKDDYKIFVNTLIFGDTQLGKIKLQSDNLLDLLEAGDMVEIKDEREDIDFDYIPMITEFDIKQGKAMKSPFSFAVAIWKRSGDVMRRYEL